MARGSRPSLGALFLFLALAFAGVTYASRTAAVVADNDGIAGDDGEPGDGPAGARDTINTDIENLLGEELVGVGLLRVARLVVLVHAPGMPGKAAVQSRGRNPGA